MGTIDIHTHLLSPGVRFDRLFDRVAVRFFASRLGTSARRLMEAPYEAYKEALVASVRTAVHVDKVCLFPVDARVDERGREVHRDRTVCSTTEDVLAVHAAYPDAIIPFLSVNPLRPDALERLDRYVEAGCRGAKFLQNYWCLDLNDRRFTRYYERLRELKIPLVVHIGSEYTIESCAHCERLEMLRMPLECGVTVIAAHMGLGRMEHMPALWRNFSRNPKWFDRDYFGLLDLLAEQPNLYADVSAILAPLRARALRDLSTRTEVHGKILFGTDYPVPFSTRLNTYDLSRSERRRLAGIGNPLDRYVETLHHYFQPQSPIYRNHAKVLAP